MNEGAAASGRGAKDNPGHEVATLGGGCFWCLDAIFRQLRGVERVESGYAGGKTRNPSYQDVCSGSTGHAEVVQVTFDPNVLSYADLLRVFFAIHDPTTLNRQGGDVGTQYRSVVLYHSPEQKAAAEQVIGELQSQGVWPGRIVSEVVPLTVFYAGEPYHQNYFTNNPAQPYCQVVIAPKVSKFRKQHLDRLTK